MTFTASLDDIIAKNANGLLAAHKSWSRVELRTVCSITNGFPFLSDKFSRSDGFPLVRIRDIIKGETETYYNGEYDEAYLVQRGELLVGMDGDFHSAMWRGRPALLNQRCCKITPNTQWIDRRFIAYVLPGYLAAIHANTAAQTVKHLSSNTVGDIKIPLPSLEVQSRISDKLDEIFSDLDAAVAGLNCIKTNLKRYRASVLQAAVEGRLTAKWRKQNPPSETGAELLARLLKERRAKWEENQLKKYAEQGKTPPKDWKEKYPEPVKPDTTGLPELPVGWVWGTIDQISSGKQYAISDGPFGSNLKTEHYTHSGPRVIRLQNIGFGEFIDENAHISESHYSTLLKHSVSSGDIVIAMLGEILPRACLVPDSVLPAIVKADCAKLSVNLDCVRQEFVNFSLNSESTRRLATKMIKGVGRPRLNLAQLKTLPVALPDKGEQEAILEKIESRLAIADVADKTIASALQRAARLRQSILKRAFEGRLVPQDPNDEPASVLLERIRAERAKQAATVKPARTRRKGKGDAS